MTRRSRREDVARSPPTAYWSLSPKRLALSPNLAQVRSPQRVSALACIASSTPAGNTACLAICWLPRKEMLLPTASSQPSSKQIHSSRPMNAARCRVFAARVAGRRQMIPRAWLLFAGQPVGPYGLWRYCLNVGSVEKLDQVIPKIAVSVSRPLQFLGPDKRPHIYFGGAAVDLQDDC